MTGFSNKRFLQSQKDSFSDAPEIEGRSFLKCFKVFNFVSYLVMLYTGQASSAFKETQCKVLTQLKFFINALLNKLTHVIS